MGMFDTIKCNYDLGTGFWNKTLQTKDLDCLMSDYWLDPAGRLFEIDYSGTQDFIEYGKDDPRYNSLKEYLNFVWVPNGNRGRIKPIYITKIILVYPAVWDCKYAPFPRCRVRFDNGIIQEFWDETNGN